MLAMVETKGEAILKNFILFTFTALISLPVWADHKGFMDHLSQKNCCVRVYSPSHVLGENDWRFAELRPNGSVTAWIDHHHWIFEDGYGDDLTIYGSDDDQGSYEVYVKPVGTWQWYYLGQGYGVSSFDLGSVGIFEAESVKIENRSHHSIRIDAIQGTNVRRDDH